LTLLKKPLLLLALDIAAFIPGVVVPAVRRAEWPLAIPTVLLVLLVVSLLWPSGGARGYFSYRTPIVVVAMAAELWIIVLGLALHLPHGRVTSDEWFQAGQVVFFLLTALNALPGITGVYRADAGLRPDLIFGGGAYLVRGEIFVALGMELILSPAKVAHPVWNWWAVVAEVAALLVTVAYRGVLKMQMRRARFLGADNWMGTGLRTGVWVREISLYLALIFVVYAFFNMYSGLVPFSWVPGDPTGAGGHPDWVGLIWLAAAFLLLVPVRGALKTRLPEPPTFAQELGKQALLWVGYIPLIYGFLLVFEGKAQSIHCCGYYNFGWGLWVSVLGIVMLIPLRTVTLREEFRGTVKIMAASIADSPDAQRRALLARRFGTVAGMADRERTIHLGLMMASVAAQPPDRQEAMRRTREAVLAEAAPAARARLQETSEALLFAGPDAESAARAAMR
jgi:hypothetical protein